MLHCNAALFAALFFMTPPPPPPKDVGILRSPLTVINTTRRCYRLTFDFFSFFFFFKRHPTSGLFFSSQVMAGTFRHAALHDEECQLAEYSTPIRPPSPPYPARASIFHFCPPPTSRCHTAPVLKNTCRIALNSRFHFSLHQTGCKWNAATRRETPAACSRCNY